MAQLSSPQDLFFQLTPDVVLDAVEACGWRTTGEYLQLNSYENRVFSVRLEEPQGSQIIAKFYRPGRWSEQAIREEHGFLEELALAGVSVVAPLQQQSGSTLSLRQQLWCAIFPKAKGRMPQEFNLADLKALGRVIARLHNVGTTRPAKFRPTLDVESYAMPALAVVQPLLTPSIHERYLDAANEIFAFLESELNRHKKLRIHGDCHRGNVLQTDEIGRPSEYFLIDFDDFLMGPAVQDFWMLFRHDDDDIDQELNAFLSGYCELRDFDEDELSLMPALMGLRIIYYAAWIARRWADPSFPQLFPHFRTEAYWFEEMQALEKVAQML